MMLLVTRLASLLLHVGLSRVGLLSSDPGSLLSLPKCLEPNPQVWVATPYTGRASLSLSHTESHRHTKPDGFSGPIPAPFRVPEAHRIPE